MRSEKTVYNYIDDCLLSARNIDLARKVRYRPRKLKKHPFKVEKNCRIGRSFEDFQNFLSQHPDTPVVQIDTVEGTKGGKVLLTIHFTESEFTLAFIRDANTARSVTEIFEQLYSRLGSSLFRLLFPVILTDNGSEFSNPSAIEFDPNGERRTFIFYCDPSSPYQKGAVENNHEFIRRIVPKGSSFNDLEQSDINLMMDHINSYGRKKLNDKSPHKTFSFLFNPDTLSKLGANYIDSNDIILTPDLLKKR
jgi:IS30 family transposase